MKVARAFEIFRKLGMRHLCVTSNTGNLVGIITRKDLMTFRLSDNIRLHKAEAMLRGWAGRWRAAQAILAEAEAKGETPGYSNATQPTVSRPFFAPLTPFSRRSFALSGFLAPRRRERAKDGGKWAKFGGETGEKQRWLSGVGHSANPYSLKAPASETVLPGTPGA